MKILVSTLLFIFIVVLFQNEHLHKCILYIALSLHTLLCSLEVIAWFNLKAEMKLYSLQCLLEEDLCGFQTQMLEFCQSKEILEMHMLLVHGRPEIRNKCNSCDRDTNVINDPDIIEDDMKARFG